MRAACWAFRCLTLSLAADLGLRWDGVLGLLRDGIVVDGLERVRGKGGYFGSELVGC